MMVTRDPLRDPASAIPDEVLAHVLDRGIVIYRALGPDLRGLSLADVGTHVVVSSIDVSIDASIDDVKLPEAAELRAGETELRDFRGERDHENGAD